MNLHDLSKRRTIMARAPVDMWPVRCANCGKKLGATNGNEGLAPIYCATCEPIFIKEADEMMALLERYKAEGRTR